MQNEPLKVSDWSQKYKLAVYAVVILGFSAFVAFVAVPWGQRIEKALNPKLGGGSSVDTFDTTRVSTKNVGATVLNIVAEDARTKYVSIRNQSPIEIFCLLDGNTTAASSSVTSTANFVVGFPIGRATASTGTIPDFYEIRGYVGNINCTASAATTSTVTISP